ncbi:MAG: hypothetical protein LAT57_07425 [Balneolales bacterium]|nr:hypothetical protein [Balneolales bacterium]
MPAYIHHIATAVPENYYNQDFVRDFMKQHVAKDRMTSMILHRIYTQSGIAKRHSVLKDFHGWRNPADDSGNSSHSKSHSNESPAANNQTPSSENNRATTAAASNSSKTESHSNGSPAANNQPPSSENNGPTAAASNGSKTETSVSTNATVSSITTDSQKSPAQTDHPEEFLFLDTASGKLRSPSTGARNALYMHEARKLFIEAAENIFAERPDLDKSSITHVVTVSCTGFYAPGPDLDVVNALGLSGSTQRYHLGFMGCYAALPALRLANSLVASSPVAVVLIVAAELCT